MATLFARAYRVLRLHRADPMASTCRSSSNRRTAIFPLSAATIAGVWPFKSGAARSTPTTSNNRNNSTS
eukprot:CAMPEP_0117612208 /NCGR_PEP_ID=MMETSP0784-20121206/82826_1 /TAXON_ID=39447 /ORGANISM="" /LENGTH=68 /DNA_ID=CAMNT_0005415747 /DNA_START=32 /DNA_END=235 /DNA_ORIENTATION=-